MNMKECACKLRVYGEGFPDMLVEVPGFSWEVEGCAGEQEAYQLKIEGMDGKVIYDSGWVETERSADISVEGVVFESDTDYITWVQVRAKSGEMFCSEKLSFSTGYLNEEMWQADWLCSPFVLSEGNAPTVRKEFSIKQALKRARMFICGLGYYELYINDAQVGSRYMDPAWTDYNKRVNYIAYNVTDMLREGTNVVGVCLGAGWYSNSEATPRPAFTVQMELEYADGSTETMFSRAGDGWYALKETWLLSNSLYIGEVVDARRMIDNWSSPDFKMDVGSWEPALESEPPSGKLTPMCVEPIGCVETKSPAAIHEPEKGKYVVDFGENIAGIVELKMNDLENGDRVKIRYAEILDEKGMLSTENLRTAQQADCYIARGGEESYKSRFTYHGFRYAEVTGLRTPLKAQDITAMVMRSKVEQRSVFSCSNELVNAIQKICVRTEGNNLHSVPTDCPQRDERLGWLNDLTVRLEEAIYNFNLDAFLKKYMADIMDAQGKKTGAITDTVPYNRFGGQPADAVCSSFVLLPWLVYQHYGDLTLLKKAWPGIKAWTDYLARQRVNGIVSYSYYGDWAAPIGGNVRFSAGNGAVSAITPGRLMSTGFLYMNCCLLEQIAAILGKKEEQSYYADLARTTADALNDTFLCREEGYYATNSQAANTFMLYLGVVPEEYRERVVDNLVRDILEHDTHITTGNLCSRYILDVLADQGKIDLAYALVTQTTYPSWGYMLSRGATTTWERWEYVDSGELVGMASHDHPMYSTVSGWFYKYLAGFRMIGAGFDMFELRPFHPSALDHARATVHTVKGDASISWKRKGNEIEAEVLVPFNSKCRYSFSCKPVGNVMVDGVCAELQTSVACAWIELSSGVHKLSFELQ